MFKAPTTEFKLPVTGVSVFIRGWITNAQAEYVEEPLQKLSEKKLLSGSADGAPAAMQVGSKRAREVYTDSITVPAEGETAEQKITDAEKITEFYNNLPSTDVEFINIKINEIVAENKKKLPAQSTLEPGTTAS